MVSGLFFLVFLAGVIVIVAWSAKMDRLPPGAQTTGLLAMDEPEKTEQIDKTGKPAASRDAARRGDS